MLVFLSIFIVLWSIFNIVERKRPFCFLSNHQIKEKEVKEIHTTTFLQQSETKQKPIVVVRTRALTYKQINARNQTDEQTNIMNKKVQSSRHLFATIMQFSQSIFVAVTLFEWIFVQSASASGVTLDLYKNKDVLATRTIPDLTALKFAHGDHKNDYFTKLLASWENLNFDRTFISRGEYIPNYLHDAHRSSCICFCFAEIKYKLTHLDGVSTENDI